MLQGTKVCTQVLNLERRTYIRYLSIIVPAPLLTPALGGSPNSCSALLTSARKLAGGSAPIQVSIKLRLSDK